ncbi:MAG: aminotransferase class V-fold PLP-dependent enzyme [Calditrichaeota bacterium]|nr:MAG: aminotransferase class V-fold PLP-dependent enzyme [Calditrichota bacterium]
MNNNQANTEKQGICGICPYGCWITATYDDAGKISKVKADDSSPFGSICQLGVHSAGIIYSKDRLKYPMKRVGKKGTHNFERISWDEAYDEIAENLQKIKAESGAKATGIYTGRGSFDFSMNDVFQPRDVIRQSTASSLLFPFGSPNTFGVGSLCYVSFGMIAPHTTLGAMWLDMYTDIENAELIIVWGANPATDSPPRNLERIVKAHHRGAKVIVIDPRRTATAKQSQAEWIPIRPGTDGALALGLCNILVKEELFDEKFVKDWTIGFDEFSQYIQHFTPEVVENITDVPAETVATLARKIAQANGVAQVMYTGLEYSASGVQAIRATLVLWALAGQLDIPGGLNFYMPGNEFPINREGNIANPDVRNAIGRDLFPLYTKYRDESHPQALPEAVLNGNPYPVRGLIVLGASIITSWPNPSLWRKTLNGLDFLVCIDRQMTADCAYADIVLPATTMYEIETYMTYNSIFKIREKMIEPVGEARSDFFIQAQIAERLGYGHLFPQTEKELFENALKGTGFNYEELRKGDGLARIPAKMMEYKKWEKGLLRADGKPGFDTPSGKFEITSTILEEYGYEPLPVYIEPFEGPLAAPDTAKNFPLIFNSGARVKTDFRSQHHGVPSLNKKRPDPTVTLNSKDAAGRNIASGDLVKLTTLRGAVEMRALVTDDIVAGSIEANMGGGGPVGPKSWQNCNINELTDLDQYDAVSGFPVYKSLLCEVEKVAAGNGAVKVDSGEYVNKTIKKPAASNGRIIYLDNNATTPMAPEVIDELQKIMALYGNPSSIHKFGQEAKDAVEHARRKIAQLINATARRIIFQSCGSEANNHTIKGIAFNKAKDGKNHIITSAIEHPSVRNTCKWLQENGFTVTYLKVDKSGRVDPAALEKSLTNKTCLVSVMLANNETGTIQPVRELAQIARDHDVLFHTDATQAVGKIPIDVVDLGVDMLTFSAHKFHGPKGIAALYASKNTSLESLINGGSQEKGTRAGTENVMGIAGFGKAAELAGKRLFAVDKIKNLRDQLESGIRKLGIDVTFNGHMDHRLPNTLNVTLNGFRGESIVLMLGQKGICFSSGSACRSGSPDPSYVLTEMGLSDEEAHCTLRFSLGHENTEAEIETVLDALGSIVKDSRDVVSFIACR